MRAALVTASLLLPGLAAAAPKPAAGSLDADLASIRDGTSWFFREVFLGWTADHRAVFRTAVCDPDDGGGRGSYCDVYLCVAKADPANPEDRSLVGDCTALTSFEIAEDDPKGQRKNVDSAAAHKAETDALAKLGTLGAGTALPASSFRATTTKKILSLVRTGKAGKGTIKLLDYSSGSMTERPQGVDSVKVSTATTDGTCVAAIGHFRFRSDYEGVPTRTPNFFGVVRCAAK